MIGPARTRPSASPGLRPETQEPRTDPGAGLLPILWAQTDSNRRHLLCKSSALPLSYAPWHEVTAYIDLPGSPQTQGRGPRAGVIPTPGPVAGFTPFSVVGFIAPHHDPLLR